MATNDMALPRPLPVHLSCGCVTLFTCKPAVGDVLLCVFHNSPVRVIRKPQRNADKVA